VNADGRWYVGPDNGLFHVVARRATRHSAYEIMWHPANLSASFHGRDLFAPVAAMLARGDMPGTVPTELSPPTDREWPEDLAEIVYIDHYGNAVTGMRAATLDRAQKLQVSAHRLSYARVYSAVSTGQAFWYENANGLAEIAVHRGSAAETLRLKCGDQISVVE
jgi:S-adenosyl-L-methionine hydrolase (adenosine-forming)